MNVSPALEKSRAAKACSRLSGRHLPFSVGSMVLSFRDYPGLSPDFESTLAQIGFKSKGKFSTTSFSFDLFINN